MVNQLREEDINIVYYDFFNHVEKDETRRRCIESWKKCMPKANFICKTENTPEIAEFIKNDRWCQECIKNDMKNYLVDTIRLWECQNIENYLYLDTDVYMFKSVLPLLNKYDTFCGYEYLYKDNKNNFKYSTANQTIYNNEGYEKTIQNGTIMWVRNKNDILKELLDEYKKVECIRSNPNIVVNFDFQKKHPELKDIALLETNEYVYHLFASMYTLYYNRKYFLVDYSKSNDSSILCANCIIINVPLEEIKTKVTMPGRVRFPDVMPRDFIVDMIKDKIGDRLFILDE